MLQLLAPFSTSERKRFKSVRRWLKSWPDRCTTAQLTRQVQHAVEALGWNADGEVSSGTVAAPFRRLLEHRGRHNHFRRRTCGLRPGFRGRSFGGEGVLPGFETLADHVQQGQALVNYGPSGHLRSRPQSVQDVFELLSGILQGCQADLPESRPSNCEHRRNNA